MISAGTRLQERARATGALEAILAHPENVVLVHYSCESFYDRADGTSPRITSIAARSLASGQTMSFSIHQMAEREGVPREHLEERYDVLEKKMLKEFYEFVEQHQKHKWVHWNMRDINYGFEAIAHRFRVLGGKPVNLHESNLFDLARLLIALYGVSYMGHPRLTKLLEKNRITAKDFLSGEQEAEAFLKKDYVKLHQSTLRKVDIFGNLLERLGCGSLKTNATLNDIYGSRFAYVIEVIKHHWFFALLALVGTILGITSLFWN